MRKLNLVSITSAFKGMNEAVFLEYLNYYGTSLKEVERNDLNIFTDLLLPSSTRYNIFNNYFLGFKIPQIGKEFDLLRLGEEFHINIELKSTDTGEDRILEQLIRNKYYLSFLNKEVFYFTFISDTKKLLWLNDKNTLDEVGFGFLIELLEKQITLIDDNISDLFNPSDYLVSPFNSTNKFIDNKYFLTEQQDDFKKQIIGDINQKTQLFLGLTGDPGTGKTLLTYDIAKSFLDNTVIIHCGYLNSGQIELKERYKWNIFGSNEISGLLLLAEKFSKYSLIIIDEAQRIYPQQFEGIIDIAQRYNITCIFSYDNKQVLTKGEEGRIDIKQVENDFKLYNLTSKVRTNKMLSNFIGELFGLIRCPHPSIKYNKKDIHLVYFKEKLEAQNYVSLLVEQGWSYTSYTPSKHHKLIEERFPMYNIYGSQYNAHTIIGQEFDDVIAVLDSSFTYGSDDKLISIYPSPYYLPVKMLFQIMTRVRKRLCIIIIDNDVIMKKCLDILNRQ